MCKMNGSAGGRLQGGACAGCSGGPAGSAQALQELPVGWSLKDESCQAAKEETRCGTAWSTEGSGVVGSWGASGIRVGDDALERQRPRHRGSSLLSGEVHVLF